MIRHLAAIWITSLALAGLAFAGLFLAGSVMPSLPSAPVMVIGTSLLRYGIPTTGGGTEAILGDGRAHVRLSVDSITEVEALRLASLALQGNTQTLIIEINPFCRDFALDLRAQSQDQHRPVSWMTSLRTGSATLRLSFDDIVLGKRTAANKFAAMFKPANFDPARNTGITDLTLLYPLNLRQPKQSDGLIKLLAAAKSKNVDVYFLAPPRSALAVQFQGGQAIVAQRKNQLAVADRFGVELIDIGQTWPNAYFIDQGHLNFAGRQRFLKELRAQWANHLGA